MRSCGRAWPCFGSSLLTPLPTRAGRGRSGACKRSRASESSRQQFRRGSLSHRLAYSSQRPGEPLTGTALAGRLASRGGSEADRRECCRDRRPIREVGGVQSGRECRGDQKRQAQSLHSDRRLLGLEIGGRNGYSLPSFGSCPCQRAQPRGTCCQLIRALIDTTLSVQLWRFERLHTCCRSYFCKSRNGHGFARRPRL